MGNVASFSEAKAVRDGKLTTFEAEQALLAVIIQCNDAYNLAAQHVRPQDFSDPFYGRCFETIAGMVSAGKAVNPVTLYLTHGEDAALADENRRRHFVELGTLSVGRLPSMVVDYAVAISGKAQRRKLLAMIDQLNEDPLSRHRPISEIAAGLNELIGEVSAGDRQTTRSLASVARGVLAQVEAAYQAGGVSGGLRTGLSALDDIVGGLKPADMLVLAGRPSMGKTACALSIGINAAKQGKRVAVFSLEMSSDQLTYRLISGETGIPTEVLRRGEVRESDWERLTEAEKTLAQCAMVIEERGALRTSEIRAISEQQHKGGALDLIIIDYLQLAKPDRDRESRTVDITEVSGGIKAMAKHLNVPVIALAQLSRAVEQREDKRPILSDLRDSGSIEQDADQVVFVYREEYYLSRSEPDTSDGKKYEDWAERMRRAAGMADLIVAKNRHGRTGDARVRFNAVRQRFEDLGG